MLRPIEKRLFSLKVVVRTIVDHRPYGILIIKQQKSMKEMLIMQKLNWLVGGKSNIHKIWISFIMHIIIQRASDVSHLKAYIGLLRYPESCVN